MSKILYLQILQSIEDNLDKYNFIGEENILPEVDFELNNFSSNVEEIYPAACSCGKRITEKLIGEYESRREFMSSDPTREEIAEYNRSSNINRLCCLNTLGSKMPIEHNIVSTYSVNTALYDEKSINKNKDKLVERVARLLHTTTKDNIIKEVKDLSNTKLDKYTPQEINEIFDLAESYLTNKMYDEYYDLFDEYEADTVKKKMSKKISNVFIVNKYYNIMLKDYSGKEYNRLKEKYSDDEKLRERIKGDKNIGKALAERYIEDNPNTDDKYFVKIKKKMEREEPPPSNIRVIDLSAY